MPDLALSPTVAVVVLGLIASLGWGISDFTGGVTTRKAPLLGVLAITQVLGVVIAVPLGALASEAIPSQPDLVWCVVSGLFGVVGLGCLYRGLGVGRMGVVAPVTGVLVAVIPVVAGFVLEGIPSSLVVAGIVLAIASVVVVSRVPSEDPTRTSGVWWGVGAGLTLGAFTVTISFVTEGLVFGPLAVVRGTEAVVAIAVIVLGRRAWRIPRGTWPAMLLIGVLDMAGTAGFVAATQAGPLAIAGVLSALYPVVTVILAVAFLREGVSRSHAVGIVVAAIAIVLIAGGSTLSA